MSHPLKHDREIVCPHCRVESMHEGIPLVNFPGDGQIFRCPDCKEHFRIGMLLEPFVSLLKRGN